MVLDCLFLLRPFSIAPPPSLDEKLKGVALGGDFLTKLGGWLVEHRPNVTKLELNGNGLEGELPMRLRGRKIASSNRPRLTSPPPPL